MFREPLFRNSNLKEVPDEHSVSQSVTKQWEKITTQIYDGIPFDSSLRTIEQSIATRQDVILNGALDPEFDWKYDLALAQFYHEHNNHWVEWHRKVRERYFSYWSDYVQDNFKYLRDLSLSGMKTIILIHGAVAIGAVNILTQKHESLVGNASSAAKIALPSAVLGIIAAGLGQLLMYNTAIQMLGKIQAKLVSNPKWEVMREFLSYIEEDKLKLRTTTYLIYASIFWFGIYSFIVLFVLIS